MKKNKNRFNSGFLLTKSIYEYIFDSYREKCLFCVSFKTKNWGDYLNKILLEKIANVKVHIIHINHLHIINFLNKIYKVDRPIMTAIGSIMHFVPDGAFVWGTGCIYNSNKFKINPSKILCVRGPLTENILKSIGHKCNGLYGDPALLFNKYFPMKNNINKNFKFGIIPHMSEINNDNVDSLKKLDCVKVINIEDNFYKVIDNVRECEVVMSSSLHGLALADMLNIPNVWVRFSDEFPGENFKFNDYYSAISNKVTIDYRPIYYDNFIKTNEFLDKCDRESSVHDILIDMNRIEEVLHEHLCSYEYFLK